jgi:Fe-S-cluster containining protein
MDSKEIDRIFYRDGYRIASQYLEEQVTAQNLVAGIETLHRGVDDLLEAFLRRSADEEKPVVCKKGCNWCCHQAVYAVTHEFLHISQYVHENFTVERRDQCLKRAQEKTLLTHHKSLREQSHLKSPCPFLESGSCSIYSVRPMGCRIYLSSSVRACKREYDDPTNDRVFPDLFEFPLRSGRMLNQGFVAYLKQVGFQSSELPIEQGYSSLLSLGQTMKGWIESRNL